MSDLHHRLIAPLTSHPDRHKHRVGLHFGQAQPTAGSQPQPRSPDESGADGLQPDHTRAERRVSRATLLPLFLCGALVTPSLSCGPPGDTSKCRLDGEE